MPIFVGTSDIDDITIGSTQQQSVYVGSDRVWIRPILYDLTVGTTSAFTDPANGMAYSSYGFRDLGATTGSLSLKTSHNPLYTAWLHNLGGVSNAASGIRILEFYDYPVSAKRVVLTMGSNTGGYSAVPNTDATFSKLTIGSTEFLRTDASSYSYAGGSFYTSWQWETDTNPFGTTNGVVKRIRFDKP